MRLVLAILLSGLVVESASAIDATVDGLAARRTPVVEVFEQSRNAVVNISSTEIVNVRRSGFDSLFEDFFDMPRSPGPTRQFTRTSVGSGFVIHEDGYIITNAHVVASTSERKVTFADGREFDAEIVAADEGSDLAVLKIKSDSPIAALPTIRLGHSGDLMIGETVIAIGNPLGYQNTVTSGVVSAVGRHLPVSRDHQLEGLIQTDASINPGNSGGPLLNVLGELIGVNTAIRGDAQNIGFAIAVDQLRGVLPELLDVERRYRIETGMRVSGTTPPRIETVAPGSPAAAAGLRVGDVVRGIDGRDVTEAVDYCVALIGREAGQTVALRVEREGGSVAATLELAGRPKPDPLRLARERLGLAVRALPAERARTMQLAPGTGLEIFEVEAGGPAESASIEPGDALVAVGKFSELTIDDLGELLEYVEPGETVSLTLRRVEPRLVIQDTLRIKAR